MQTCPQCKTQQLNGVIFCAECGASLLASGPPRAATSLPAKPAPVPAALSAETAMRVPVPPAPAAGRSISLVVITSGRRITLQASNDLLVGRKDNTKGIYPDVDLGLDGGYDAGVSRRHAIIAPQASGWVIQDLGSPNGTSVNGQRLAPQHPTALRSGDELKFGTLLLKVEL